MNKVADKYYIDADSNCCITGKLGIIKKKGEETPALRQRSHYNIVTGALKRILSVIMGGKAFEEEAISLKEYLEGLKREYARLEELLPDFEEEKRLSQRERVFSGSLIRRK